MIWVITVRLRAPPDQHTSYRYDAVWVHGQDELLWHLWALKNERGSKNLAPDLEERSPGPLERRPLLVRPDTKGTQGKQRCNELPGPQNC
mmetsp:Transcript_45376/g.120342  ORF Transcript_45376/g.120342 Transcript_45376/m.120342 type:complete len:90 (-) Transcript_45376:218-487(-)